MKSKTKSFILILTILSVTFLSEIFYIKNVTRLTQNQIDNKQETSTLIALPNLSVSSNELFLRHKSYANIFDILPYDGELQSNSKMDFVY